MPTHSGLNTLGESNLVFAYDTGDVSNSYKGQPTVNLITSPQFTSHNNVTVGDASIIKVDFGEGSGYYPNMELPIFRIYNRALTAQEVKQNYQQYKTRFNLS